jgi:glycosyltransferase involved in cell wall biosynthesis
VTEAGTIREEGGPPEAIGRAEERLALRRDGGANGRRLDGVSLAIVAEQCNQHGGTERVIEALLRHHPQAAVLAPRFSDQGGGRWSRADGRRVATAWRAGRCWHYLGPLYARRMRQLEPPQAKLVVSMVSHGWGGAVSLRPDARQLVYYAGPSGALYTRSRDYLRATPWALRPLVRAALPALRRHYQRSFLQADRVIANSNWAAAAFAREHGYRPEVIHPPARTDFFTPAAGEREQLLFVGRQVHHKRIGDLVEAFRSLEQRLVVVGDGPLLPALRRAAPPNVHFRGSVEDEELRALYRASTALIHPSVEEFGIVMAEAHACGTPVIAPRAGGALEIVDDGRTGLLLDKVEPASIAAAVEELGRRSFDWAACRSSAERFSERIFGERFDRVLAEEFERADR